MRVWPDLWVNGSRLKGRLLHLRVHKGICRLLKDLSSGKKDVLRQHVVVRWRPGSTWAALGQCGRQ